MAVSLLRTTFGRTVLAPTDHLSHDIAPAYDELRQHTRASACLRAVLVDRSKQIVPWLVAQITNLLPILIGFLLHAERLQHERAMVGYHGQRAFLLPLLLH